jgi:uncharacterized protein
MCGPLTLALAGRPAPNPHGHWRIALGFNAGRLVAYTVAGVVAYWALGGPARSNSASALALLFRLGAAGLVALIGVSLLGLPWLARLERAMTPAWVVIRRLLAPLARLSAAAPAPLRPVLFGLLWLLMPCGLIYSMLLVAATRDSPWEAALVMGAFGLGTLPALLGLSLAGVRLGQWLHRRQTQRWLGALLVVAAIVAATITLQHASPASHDAHAHHHG